MTTTVDWQGDDFETLVRRELEVQEQELHRVSYQTLRSMSAVAEVYMKNNASWTDRTGNARQGLYTEVNEIVNGAEMRLSHGVWYGIFLELAHQSDYAIVLPAYEYFGAELMRVLLEMFPDSEK